MKLYAFFRDKGASSFVLEVWQYFQGRNEFRPTLVKQSLELKGCKDTIYRVSLRWPDSTEVGVNFTVFEVKEEFPGRSGFRILVSILFKLIYLADSLIYSACPIRREK